ncbi:MAG: hypothetical protein HZB44_03855 [Actinobacteria bacterium]|nr:hypothetical protein [Actinomycetota bacterium]
MNEQKQPIAGLHLVRYGTAADQKFLLGEFLATYDQLVINANMLAHMPAAMASFLTQQTKNKPYFIDPQTHAFQHDLSHIQSSSKDKSEFKIKRSIDKLLDEYGDPVYTRVKLEKNSVLPEDFNDSASRKSFCERVLNYQISSIPNEIERDDVKKYFEFSRGSGFQTIQEFSPSLTVAPYFFMAAGTVSDWLPVNLECAKDSIEIARQKNISIAVQVVISKEVLLDDDLRKEVIDGYKGLQEQPDVFLVWVDSFSERNASSKELERFIEFLNLVSQQSQVVNLYGGFFSTALKTCSVVKNLVGVTHSLEYGEERAVVPVGGGIPVAKFYLPSLHVRLPFRDALRAVRALGGDVSVQEFHKKVCNCKECRKVIKNDPNSDFALYGQTKPLSFMRKNQPVIMEYPLPETKTRCVKHYMWRKDFEYTKTLSKDKLIRELGDAETALGRALGLDAVSHCRVWSQVIGNCN